MAKTLILLTILLLLFCSCATVILTSSHYVSAERNRTYHECDWRCSLDEFRLNQGMRVQLRHQEARYYKFRTLKTSAPEQYYPLYHAYCDTALIRMPRCLQPICVDLITGDQLHMFFHSFDVDCINLLARTDGEISPLDVSRIRSISDPAGRPYDWPEMYERLMDFSIPLRTAMIFEYRSEIVNAPLHEIEKIFLPDPVAYKWNTALFVIGLLIDGAGTYFLVKYVQGVAALS